MQDGNLLLSFRHLSQVMKVDRVTRRRALAARRHPQRLHLPRRPVRRPVRPAHRPRAGQRRHPGLGQRLAGRPSPSTPMCPDGPRRGNAAPRSSGRSAASSPTTSTSGAHGHPWSSSSGRRDSFSGSPARRSGWAPGRSPTTCSSGWPTPTTRTPPPSGLTRWRSTRTATSSGPSTSRLLLLPRPEVPRPRRHRTERSRSPASPTGRRTPPARRRPSATVHRPRRQQPGRLHRHRAQRAGVAWLPARSLTVTATDRAGNTTTARSPTPPWPRHGRRPLRAPAPTSASARPGGPWVGRRGRASASEADASRCASRDEPAGASRRSGSGSRTSARWPTGSPSPAARARPSSGSRYLVAGPTDRRQLTHDAGSAHAALQARPRRARCTWCAVRRRRPATGTR